MTIRYALLLSATCVILGACDAVRTPWSDDPPPQRPTPVIPDGAPGPPPPTELVVDPYGEGLGDTDAPENTTDVEDTTDAGDSENTETNPPQSDTPTTSPPPPPLPIKFQYIPPGQLIPNSGTGREDATIYAPDMLFPIRQAAAIPQSMVYRPGGAVAGDQCDPVNYELIWQDNFCEQRSSTRNTPLCPTNKVHQGQDIRVGTASDCNTLRRTPAVERGLHEAIAVEDGIIQYIGTYSVQLKGTQTGNLYSYLHLNMARLDVTLMQDISAGDRIGYVSNDFGGVPTTFHLHFEIKAPLEDIGFVHVPPYTSLIAAYERREQGRGERLEQPMIGVASLPTFTEIPDMIE